MRHRLGRLRFVDSERGAAAVEYAILAAAVAAVIALVAYGLGTKVETAFSALNGLIP